MIARTHAGAWALSLFFFASSASAQRVATLDLRLCPRDLPASEWRLRVHHELVDEGVQLVAPLPFVSSVRPELRVVLRSSNCASGTETYEVFLSRDDGSEAQSALLLMEGLPPDERPQLAAVRIATIVHTHRHTLLPSPADRVEVPPQRERSTPFVTVELGTELTMSRITWLMGGQLGVTVRPSPSMPIRARFELGLGPVLIDGVRSYGSIWLGAAGGFAIDVVHRPDLEVALGGRAEFAWMALPPSWVGPRGVPAGVPTVRAGMTVEAHVVLDPQLWLWARAEVGGYVLGAQLRLNGGFFNGDMFTGPTAALSLGLRWDFASIRTR
jgi:hypothetical protein